MLITYRTYLFNMHILATYHLLWSPFPLVLHCFNICACMNCRPFYASVDACYLVSDSWLFFSFSFLLTKLTWLNQIEIAQKAGELMLFVNEEHPQFGLRKVKRALLPLFVFIYYRFYFWMTYQLSISQKEVVKSRNREVVELFGHGFGIHHAGMLRADRSLTERLFSDGLLKVRYVFCS